MLVELANHPSVKCTPDTNFGRIKDLNVKKKKQF